MRSYESLKTEIVSNYENFGTRVYTFSDNIMNDYDEKLKYLIRIKDETGIDLRWTGFIRLDTIVKKEQAVLLKESGIASAYAGIESLKKEVGPYIGKVTDKSRILKSLEIFRDGVGENCSLTGGFICGLPTETVDDLWNSFNWLNSRESQYYIDSLSFSPFFYFPWNKDKNSINIARNDPFKDYEGSYMKWTSPWGTSEMYNEVFLQFEKRKRKTQLTSFNLPYIHNLGINIEDAVRLSRLHSPVIEREVLSPLIIRQRVMLNTYKKNVLTS